MRSWMPAKSPLAPQVTIAAVSISEPSRLLQVSHRPASAIGRPSARRIA